jgi:hypothetical protein
MDGVTLDGIAVRMGAAGWNGAALRTVRQGSLQPVKHQVKHVVTTTSCCKNLKVDLKQQTLWLDQR